MIALCAVVLGIWLYLFFARAGFWRLGQWVLPKRSVHNGENVRVSVIVPARNESDVIEAAIRSLLSQEFAGEVHIFLIDDNSSDDTADRARSTAGTMNAHERLSVLKGSPLPAGWSGKVWAQQQGWEALRTSYGASGPDYVLLTDADIVHDPHSVASLVGTSQSGNFDLTSQMVRLHCCSWAERLLIPAFVYFFFLLYPPKWIADPDNKMAGAAGGCILIRPKALESAGGFASIKAEIIDDCSLARRVKQAHGRLWLGVAEETRSVRAYNGFSDVQEMIARTAFNQLRHSWPLLAGCVVGLLLTFIAPIAMLFVRPWVGIAASGMMLASYFPMVRYYRLHVWHVLILPFATLFYLYATVLSAVRYWRGGGGAWKGRVQDPA